MALTDIQTRSYTKKLLQARMNIISENPFYGSLLMNATLSLDEECPSAYTDSERICFGTKFLDNLSRREVEFIMLHEILHIILNHCKRGAGRNDFLFNLACDIVVNSTILESYNEDISRITLAKYGESFHTVPDGREGRLFSAEEVYEMLLDRSDSDDSSSENIFTDDHSQWKEPTNAEQDTWQQRIVAATETAIRIKSGNKKCKIPRAINDMVLKIKIHPLDWRKLLHNFIEEEVCDYSFNPPDRRFSDSDFFLPDFNEMGESDRIKNVLFMVDASASITDIELQMFYSEIENALNQFNGRLEGLIGFFDAGITDPVPFSNTDELKKTKPIGGGGTSYEAVFEYIRKNMSDNPPVSIVIFTDGGDTFPDESVAMGIPVLWVMSVDVDAPWGITAKIESFL